MKFQKQRLCLLTSVMLCSLFWTSWPEMGPIVCPKMLIRIYHLMLHSHMMIWWCRPWFGSALSSLVLHMRIYDDLTCLRSKFKVKTSSCIRVYMVFWRNLMPAHLKQILLLHHWYPEPNNTAPHLRDNYHYSHCQQNVRSHTGKLDVL